MIRAKTGMIRDGTLNVCAFFIFYGLANAYIGRKTAYVLFSYK